MHNVLMEWTPVGIFVAVYLVSDLLTATIAIIAVTAVIWLWCKLTKRPMSKIQEYSYLTLWLLGGMTLALNDPLFIMWKPTLVYVTIAAVLAINVVWSERPLLRGMMERFYLLKTRGWQRLQWVWSGLFVVLGLLNLLVAYNFSVSVWVQYKLFGNLFLMLLFLLLQSWFLRGNMAEQREGGAV